MLLSYSSKKGKSKKSSMSLREYTIHKSPHPSEVKRPRVIQEVRSIIQPIKLLSQYRKLTKLQHGNGQRVMLFPGWKSHETVMYPLKAYLSKLGYAPEYWGLGINNGKLESYRDKIVAKLKAEDRKDKLTLIGWSLGGVVAREIAREIPEKISGVVTYGTPVIGGPAYTIGAKSWGAKETERIIALIDELDRANPIQVPMSIIFTKNDSIVTWSACLDSISKNVKHYEVKSTHLSLGIDPEVWRIVATHLQNVA